MTVHAAGSGAGAPGGSPDAAGRPGRDAEARERAARLERRFELPMLAAALLTIPALALESLPPDTFWRGAAVALNWLIWGAFTLELMVMLRVAPSRGRWLREHPLEVAIVLFTAPFLPASFQATRLFRLLRLLRLMAAVKFARAVLSPQGLPFVALLSTLVVIAGGTAFSVVERGQTLTAWDGVWWAVTTVTTVGYGDIAPKTAVGRAIAVVVMLVGIGFVALLTATAAQRLMARGEAARSGDGPPADSAPTLETIDRRLQRLEQLLEDRLDRGR